MAAWVDKDYNSQKKKCNVCLAQVANKNFHKHVIDCYERNKVRMESIGVIRCPLDPCHIFPVAFLNHHLDGNCQEFANKLRKFYQLEGLFKEPPKAPPEYLEEVPEKYLSQQNKNMLYMIDENLHADINQDWAALSNKPKRLEELEGPVASTSQDDVDWPETISYDSLRVLFQKITLRIWYKDPTDDQPNVHHRNQPTDMLEHDMSWMRSNIVGVREQC